MTNRLVRFMLCGFVAVVILLGAGAFALLAALAAEQFGVLAMIGIIAMLAFLLFGTLGVVLEL